MRLNAIVVFILVSILSHVAFANMHHLNHDELSTVTLQDGDEIVLDNLPFGWGFNRIVLGVNSMPAMKLSGAFAINGCKYMLDGYYKQLDFQYMSSISIKYSGPTQSLPMHWWVDVGFATSTCVGDETMSREDSIRVVLKQFADSLYADKSKDYKSLGALNSENFFSGSSFFFKIDSLPDRFYNRIYVLVESIDGRELNGFSYAGGKKVKLSGWSVKFAVNQRNAYFPTFELAFPEFRKVKMKWWVEVGSPEEVLVSSKNVDFGSDSVEVTYTFGASPYVKPSVSLIFDKRNFVDGKIPVVKKLSFDPQGAQMKDDLAVRGNIYDFNAKLNSGDSVVLALPLDFEYNSETDSLSIEHFIEEENRWIEEPVDSVVGNYAYFKVGHFSWLRSICRGVTKLVTYTVAPATAICSYVSNSCKNAVNSFVNGAADVRADILSTGGDAVGYVWEKTAQGAGYIIDGVTWVVNLIESLVCFDGDELKRIFSSPKASTWSVGQGSLPLNKLYEQRNSSIPGQSIVDELIKVRNKPLSLLKDSQKDGICNDHEEVCKWRQTQRNLDILLADAILAKMDPAKDPNNYGRAKYVFSTKDGEGFVTKIAQDGKTSVATYSYTDYFMTSSGLIENAADFVSGVESCLGSLNYTGEVVQTYSELFRSIKNGSYTGACRAIFDMWFTNSFEYVGNTVGCSEFISHNLRPGYSVFDSHSGKLVSISDAMVRLSLLAWISKTEFRNFSLEAYKPAYDGIRAWLELAGPFFDYNNIAIKAYGSIALYEYIHYGTEDNLKMVNSGLDHHYGDNGGYSEGMGYSQYIWDDLTYVFASMKDAYALQGESFEINGKFLKSPDYMLEFSRPVANFGLVPVEIDDGVTYNPDYRVWAKLKNEAKYLKMSESYPLQPEDGKINVLVPFGFPEETLYESLDEVSLQRGSLWGSFKDGIGMISVVNEAKQDTVSLSMIAEKGNLWTRGQSHDQQDNLSITLSSSKNGFIIQDRGYSGFESRGDDDAFHHYNDHNVLTNYWGQRDNRAIGFSEMRSRATEFTGVASGFGISLLSGELNVIFNMFGANPEFQVEGGYEASVINEYINDPENGIVGYTAMTALDSPQGASPNRLTYNNRTILYFGGNLWVVDRPEEKGMTWLANSPKGPYWKIMTDNGVNIYGASSEALEGGSAVLSPIPQNGSRGSLMNYPYSLQDKDALTYVMTYPVIDEGFIKTETNCPQNYQCFENSTSDKRLVVPPRNKTFKICDALPANECSGDINSSGITLMKKIDAEKWRASWVLDGELTIHGEHVVWVDVSRTNYAFAYTNGTVVSGKYESPYLPAIPILLLR